MDEYRKRGCVIESIIASSIVLILAAIAIPDFLKFQGKACGSEVKTNLNSIFKKQVEYIGEHGRFAGRDGMKGCFDILDWELRFGGCGGWGQNIYSYYCDTSVIPNAKGDKNCPIPAIPRVTERSFTIYAVGNVDGDTLCDVWTINDAKIIKNVVVDP